MTATSYNPLTALLFARRPEGFGIEARHSDRMRWTDYRYTRLSDGVWCQHFVSDLVVEYAISLDGVADEVTATMLRKFSELNA